MITNYFILQLNFLIENLILTGQAGDVLSGQWDSS